MKKIDAFGLALATLANQNQVNPREAMEAFGYAAGLFISKEVFGRGTSMEAAQKECMDLYSDGVVRGIERGRTLV